MHGFQLTFFTQQDRLVHGQPLGQWLLQAVKQVGVSGATLQTAAEGFGRDGQLHASHFFELAGQPQQVTMAVSPEVAQAVFALLAAQSLNIFYVKTPIEFGMSADRDAAAGVSQSDS